MLGDYHLFPEIILRSVVVYLVILAGFRLAGKRHISQLSLLDFALILLISNAVQNAMVGTDTSLFGGIVAAVSLLAANLILTKLISRNKLSKEFLVGEPKLLIRNSKLILSTMEHENLSEEDLLEAIREHGFESLSEVRTAILELDGSISIIPYPQAGQHIEHHMAPITRKRRGRKRIL
ncbi:MAG: YetF domain-containing protein [bacterium]